jgi:hypothetical protein
MAAPRIIAIKIFFWSLDVVVDFTGLLSFGQTSTPLSFQYEVSSGKAIQNGIRKP